jgi:hypothetical protein
VRAACEWKEVRSGDALALVNNQVVLTRLLRGAFAVLAVVIAIFVVSVVSVFFVPIPSRALGLAMFLVLSGPEVFRPALHPAAPSAWPAVGWIVIAVGFGIATRNVTSRLRVFGYAVVVVFAWLSWQEALVNRYISNDWRRGKDADLQQRIFTETPLGSSMSQVEDVIRREGWDRIRIDRAHGFLDQRERRARRSGTLPQTVGMMSIQANAGDFQGVPFQSNVTVFWGFDQDGKLIDAWAWRTTDAL